MVCDSDLRALRLTSEFKSVQRAFLIHGNDLVRDRADLVQVLPGGEKVIAH